LIHIINCKSKNSKALFPTRSLRTAALLARLNSG
jgi:hypothetical protein